MPTYSGVTFDILGNKRPLWKREITVNRRKIAGTNREDTQYGGLSNPKLRLTAVLQTAGQVETLQAAAGSTGRTLTNLYGTDYSDVRLSFVGDPYQDPTEDIWYLEVEFEREAV